MRQSQSSNLSLPPHLTPPDPFSLNTARNSLFLVQPKVEVERES